MNLFLIMNVEKNYKFKIKFKKMFFQTFDQVSNNSLKFKKVEVQNRSLKFRKVRWNSKKVRWNSKNSVEIQKNPLNF